MIAVAWVFYRPIFAVALIGIVVAIVMLLRNRGKKKVELAANHPIYEAH